MRVQAHGSTLKMNMDDLREPPRFMQTRTTTLQLVHSYVFGASLPGTIPAETKLCAFPINLQFHQDDEGASQQGRKPSLQHRMECQAQIMD